MKPENTLKRRMNQAKEICRQLVYPYAFIYADTFDMENKPLKANLWFNCREKEDLLILLNTIRSAIDEYFGRDVTDLTDSSSLRTGEPYEPPVEPPLLEDCCEFGGG